MKHRIALLILSSALLGLTACKLEGGGLGSSSAPFWPGSSGSSRGESSDSSRSSGNWGWSSSSNHQGSSAASSKSHEGPWTLADGGDIGFWCSNMEKDYFCAMAEEFKELHPEYQGEIKMKANVDDYSVYLELVKDVEAAADVFILPDDNIRQCADARLLMPFESDDVAQIEGLYDEMALDSGCLNGIVYGLPYRNDNGYVLSYDKRIVSEEDAKSVEGIIAACKKAGATFNFNLDNGWYSFAPVWPAGGRTYFDEDGKFVSKIATDEVAEALVAFQKIVKDAGNTWVQDDYADWSSDPSGKIGAIVRWNNEAAWKEAIGENVASTVMPTFQGNGKTYQMKSFQCFKTIAVRKAVTMAPDKLVVAREFAKFLCSDKGAEERLVSLGQGVPNKAVIAKTELWTSDWVKALSDQQLAGNTVSQSKSTCGAYWNAAQMVGNSIARGQLTDKAAAMAVLESAQQAMMQENY